MIDSTKFALRAMCHMLKILDRPGWAYWLAWGVVVSIMTFGVANIIAAIKL
ncbi:hypothetical protein [Coralloluteibacterium thermophilus]|uniref:Uncharacterized protein n=1 Tax=Coralloluteibacterium thermophilum TaxID=2707049 RepID=A0ABV9NP36_9GAMM